MATPVKYAMQNEGRIALAVVRKVAVVMLAIGLAACNPDKVRRILGLSTGAPVCSIPGPLSDTAQLRTCVNDLTFDPLTAVGDEQRLLVRDDGGAACFGDSAHTCRHGPLAKIEPVIGADERDAPALDQGAIIARLFLRENETESYPKLNLAPGDTTYWWVQRQTDTTAISRYLRISQGQVIDTLVGTIKIEQHPEGTFSMALARFIWDDGDEKTQGACTSGGCCR